MLKSDIGQIVNAEMNPKKKETKDKHHASVKQ
jgi:hypothetical protein